jgi:predicted alpha/beta-fold hydrolase
VVDSISVPTLIISAMDDPFIRMFAETRKLIQANPMIDLVETRHGGHCAYLSRDAGEETHWAEATVIRYFQAVTGGRNGS